MTIQTLFDECVALEKQRHLAQRISVAFSFDLRIEDHRRFGPNYLPLEFDLSIAKGQGSFTYAGQRTIRLHPPKGQSLGQLVVIPGNLVATISASVSVSVQGGGGLDSVQENNITISAPIGGGISTIDVVGTDPVSYPLVFEVEPNTSLPLEIITFIPVHTKSTLVLALSPAALVSTLPPGPVHVP
jgi:hypothetical protein